MRPSPISISRKRTNILSQKFQKLWDEMSTILPDKKPNNTIGRPSVPLEKYWMTMFMFLEQDVSGKCYLMNMVLVPHVIGDFSNGFG